MTIVLTTCAHCGSKQATITPWKTIPVCHKCHKLVVKELPNNINLANLDLNIEYLGIVNE
jgi:hypothetical protein